METKLQQVRKALNDSGCRCQGEWSFNLATDSKIIVELYIHSQKGPILLWHNVQFDSFHVFQEVEDDNRMDTLLKIIEGWKMEGDSEEGRDE